MIFNPIIRKEVLSSLRTRKAVIMQVAFLLIMAALVWRSWPADGLQDIGSQQARMIFATLAIGQLAMVAMFAPAFTAASLTAEAEHNTLDSLFCTRLRPWEIATGKMIGSLAFLILLVLSGVPALATAMLMGGITGRELLTVVAILLLTAVYMGMIGLLVSSMMHRSYRAMIVTYAILLVVCLLFAVPAWPVGAYLITRQSSAFMQGLLHCVSSLSPFEAMISLVLPDSTYAVGARGMPAFWVTYIPLSALAIALLSAVCLVRLRRPPPPPRPREGLRVVERGRVTVRTFMFVVDPRKRKKPIRWWQNPVLLKEFRTRPMMQAQWLLRATGICMIVAVLLMILVAVSVTALVHQRTDMIPAMVTAVAALMVLMLILVGPAITGGTICSDIESGVWDIMRTTKLSSFTIVSGKFQAAVLPLLLLTVSMTPALVILLYFVDGAARTALWVNVPKVLYVVGMATLFVATAGMFFSSIFRRTATATTCTYALVIALGLVSLLVLLDPGGLSQRLVRSIFLLNPVAVAMGAAGAPGLAKYDLLAGHLKIMGAATAAMFLITVIRVVQLRRAG